jgi:hypothetical protein
MALHVPAYIQSAQVATNTIRYPWDEWRVKDYFMEVDDDQFDRLDRLSDAANLALAIGCGEWISYRFAPVSDDPDPSAYIEAAWAAIIHPAYCLEIETDDDEWRGPVRGPLNMTVTILNDGIHQRETDPHEATRACWMYNLASHVLPSADEFSKWFEASVLRLEQYHPWIEDNDIWEEGPPFGIPVPRESLDPSFPYDPKKGSELLDLFLRSLAPSQNPFLIDPEDLLETPGFVGTPYQFAASQL